jgi:hypothetical protein
MSKPPTAQLYISGSIPCVICGEAITQANVDRGDVIALMGRFVYPAHLVHFYNDTQERQPDYEDQMTRLALANAIGEGLEMPGLESNLRPLYEEIKTQMTNWNHPAFFIRPEDRN